MSENKLKTAVLGLKDKGRLLLEAAAGIEQFEIAAVADKDTKLAEKTALKYSCRAYDDYRQLIIQNQFDCLLVAAGMHTCEQYLRAAMKKKFNILKLAPPARNFEEAVEFVQLAEDENIKFAVGNPSRFAQSFTALQQYLQEGKIEQIFLVTAFCTFGNEQQPSWQTDPKLAGGGVLLHNCYDIIDQILCNFAAPQQVYSLSTNTVSDRGQRSYLTEDTAVITMKFSDSYFGNLIASKVFGQEQKLLKLYGKDKILTVSNSRLTISDCLGQLSEQLKYDDDEIRCMTKQLKNFAFSILSPDKNKLRSSGRENLKDMAVIESAYLSARTAMPEEPARILEMASRQAGKAINT
ncbi:MAG: Gfo/Idh/MocA family oxidoreductase [Planctomycetota bacterium]|nr:MAG: Gfo/Idh/MocA family oxidoreductase [Planctomycetota bacterium]